MKLLGICGALCMFTNLSANFQELPKSELHLHLGGSYPLEYVLSLASAEQGDDLKKYIDNISNGMAYSDAFRVFQIVSQIINTEDRVQKGTEEVCKALQKDGVVYVEIRTGLKNYENGPEGYLKAVLRGIANSNAPNFQAKLLLSLQRNSSLEMAKKTVDLAIQYKEHGIVGIDLSGDSTIGQVETILPELLRARQSGLSLLVHMGESPHETDQLRLLEELMPNRIGHGVHLSPDAEAWILQNRIPIEVCLTSSVMVQMIERYEDHPGLRYFRQGHPIAFCTDDPLIFSTTLSQELEKAEKHGKLSREEIEQIVRATSGGL